MDLHTGGYRTYDDLLGYMEGSAAVIGTMMAPILESADPPAAREHARQLGLAFQLTNFIRDVAEDHRRGRIAAADLSASGSAGPTWPPPCHPGRGRAAGLRGRAGRSPLCGRRAGHRAARPSSRPCVRVAFELYGGILDEVERARYQVPFAGSPSTATAA